MKKETNILKFMTYWILISVVSTFVLSSVAVFVITTKLSKEKSELLLTNNIEDLRQEIIEADSIVFTSSALRNAIAIEDGIFSQYKSEKELQEEFVTTAQNAKISEMFYVDSTGIVRYSNIPDFVGFDMQSTDISRQFLRQHPTELKDSAYVTPLLPHGLMNGEPRKYIAGRFHRRNGFVVLGISEKYVVANMNFMLSNSAHYRRVGEAGGVYIFDSNLDIVSAPIKCKAQKMDEVGIDKQATETMPEKTLFEATIMDEPCVCCHSYLAGYHMLAVQPASESTYNRDAALRSRTTSGLIIFSLLFLAIWLIVRKLVGGLNKVNASLTKISDGNLNERVQVYDTIEFRQLSEHTNQMVDKLKGYIKEAENRVAADLALAKSIQSSSLPSVFPAFPDHEEFDIHALMKTAREVGGDFYDFFFVGENKLALVMADVAGKGIPAAMFMMRSKSALKNHASTGLPLTQVCSEVNNVLCKANDTQTFFTAWIGVFNIKTGLLTYINAGHNYPIIRRNGEPFSYLECKPNIPMAAFEDFPFQEESIQLKPGDELFLYTDGVTEATSTSLELFGDDRLLNMLNTMPEEVASTSQSICQHVLKEVQQFALGAEQSDDITMLSFKYLK